MVVGALSRGSSLIDIVLRTMEGGAGFACCVSFFEFLENGFFNRIL